MSSAGRRAETKLTLTGVFMYADEDKRIAIISKGSDDQSAYGIGDMITDDIELKAIEEDSVIIYIDGGEEGEEAGSPKWT